MNSIWISVSIFGFTLLLLGCEKDTTPISNSVVRSTSQSQTINPVLATPESQTQIKSASVNTLSGVLPSLTIKENQPVSPKKIGDWSCLSWQTQTVNKRATFQWMRAMTTDGENVYISDESGHVIRKVELGSGRTTTIAGSGKEQDQDGVGRLASLGMILGMATNGKWLYAADIIHKKIRKIDLSNNQVSSLAISSKVESKDAPKGWGNEIQGALALAGHYLYVSYATNIRKIDLNNGQMTEFAGKKEFGRPGKDGVGADASFTEISRMVTDGENLYVIGRGISDLRKVELSTGRVSTILSYQLRYPEDLTVINGAIYTTDYGHLIRIDLQTHQISTLEGPSDPGLEESVGHVNISSMIAAKDRLYLAQVQQGEIKKVNLTTETMVPLSGLTELGSEDGSGSVPELKILGVGQDGAHLWVGDADGTKIQKLDLKTGEIKTVFQSNSDNPQFNNSQSVVEKDGILLIADYGNHLLRQLDLNTKEISTVSGSETPGFKEGDKVEPSFNYPRNLVSDEHSLYVSDYDNHAIRKVNRETGLVENLAGSGKAGFKDGLGKDALFRNPRGLALTESTLYVADTYNHAIRSIDLKTNRVKTLAGSGREGFKDGQGTKALFSYPQDVVVLGDRLYVTDYGNNRIRQIQLSTGEVTSLAGNGLEGAQDGKGEGSSFDRPSRMVTDGRNLYVADNRYRSIRKVEGSTVTTLGGGSCK